jgi:hypothetical protein
MQFVAKKKRCLRSWDHRLHWILGVEFQLGHPPLVTLHGNDLICPYPKLEIGSVRASAKLAQKGSKSTMDLLGNHGWHFHVHHGQTRAQELTKPSYYSLVGFRVPRLDYDKCPWMVPGGEMQLTTEEKQCLILWNRQFRWISGTRFQLGAPPYSGSIVWKWPYSSISEAWNWLSKGLCKICSKDSKPTIDLLGVCGWHFHIHHGQISYLVTPLGLLWQFC